MPEPDAANWQDGRQWLRWVYTPERAAALRQHPAVEILRRVWVQQYYIHDDEGHWHHTDNMPSAEHVIHSPYDPEARYSHKRDTAWFGYKAPITETWDAERPHLLMHIETTPATLQDEQVTETIQRALEQKHMLPAEHLLHRGYVTTPVPIDSENTHGVEVIGPMQMDTTWQAQLDKGFDGSCFTIDWDSQCVTCPGGQMSQVWAESRDNAGNPRVYVRFAKASYQACPVRTDCTRSVNGPRTLSFKPRSQHELLQWTHEREHTDACKERYAKRAGIEGTISQGTRIRFMTIAVYGASENTSPAPAFSCCRQRERGTSGRWRQSAPGPCWAGTGTGLRLGTLPLRCPEDRLPDHTTACAPTFLPALDGRQEVPTARLHSAAAQRGGTGAPQHDASSADDAD